MALTDFQRAVCRLLAGHRLASGESYVAGAGALNELVGSARVSRDIDVFHDTDTAVRSAWDVDRAALQTAGLSVGVVRERPSYIEAEVGNGAETVRMEWTRDSAFRFFPLMRHDELGLVLHPFDLATNKILALVGRLEVRDWIDVIESAVRVQPLGYLAWAASGKDPGFGPAAILEHAARSSHYSADEVAELVFVGEPPDVTELSRRWHGLLAAARQVVDALPPEHAGTCVLTRAGELFRGDAADATAAYARGDLVFHPGRIGGAIPRLR